MHIGPVHLHGAQSVNAPHHASGSADVARPGQSELTPVDQLDLSPEAQRLDETTADPEIRWDRVRDIRAQIEAGAYETADKLEMALNRLMDDAG